MTMRPCDREMLDRLERTGNALGWVPHSRDPQGNAIMRCTVTKPGGTLKITYMKITPQGLYYDTVEHGNDSS